MSETPTTAEDDELYHKAVKLVVDTQNGSTSQLQRHFCLTYNKGAALMERLEKSNIVSAPDKLGKRRVLWEEIDD